MHVHPDFAAAKERNKRGYLAGYDLDCLFLCWLWLLRQLVITVITGDLDLLPCSGGNLHNSLIPLPIENTGTE